MENKVGAPQATENEELRQRIEAALDDLRPYLQNDGGDVELLNINEDGVLEMHFVGSCQGCPMSMMTLKMGIENYLKENVPEVKEVVAV